MSKRQVNRQKNAQKEGKGNPSPKKGGTRNASKRAAEIESFLDFQPVRQKAGAPEREKKRRTEREKTSSRRLGSGKGEKLTAMDFVVAFTGFLVVAVACVTTVLYVRADAARDQAAALAEVGQRLESVGNSGAEVLTAVADAYMASARETEETDTEESREGYEEKELDTQVKLGLKLTSVEKDLKIKFTNKTSGKLVGNQPFAVKLEGPENRTLSDDDRDGIIYVASIASGIYNVTVTAPEQIDGSPAAGLSGQVTVKDRIAYEKIDVADEVKKESEINAAKEDTEVKNQVESVLQDTVEWVESTKTPLGGESYEEVARGDIPEPSASAALELIQSHYFSLERVQTVTEPDGTAVTENEPAGPGSTEPVPPTETQGEKPPETESEKPSEPESQKPPETEGEKPTESESEKPTESESQKPSEPEKPSEAVKVTGVTVTADPARAESGKTVKLKAAVSLSDGSSYSGSISWSADGGSLTASGAEASLTSSDPRKVTVTAAAEGTKGSVTVEFFKEDRKVTGLKLPDKVSVAVGETVSLSLTVEPKDASNKETEWKLVEGDGVISLENGKVKGKKAGTARVKAVAKDGSNVSSNECTVTVELKDSKAPLKDKNGAQLYRKDGDTYREATAADYYSKEKLYRKKESGQYRYTGWQTIDGRRYYFDKNGNPVTGDQVIQGMKYSFNSDGSMKTGSVMGIDVSRHNGNVDWNAVKASGVDFVILRCGYRGSSTGALIEDQTFRKNIKGASAAGLKIGVYVFSQAVNSVEAVEEASLALSLVQGYKLTYPIFIDVESANGRADGLSAAARTQIITSFCQTVQNSGYKAGIYANKTWLSSKMNVGALGNYRIWLAQYAAAPTYGGRYEMWQYSSQGSIPGISGHVDLNVSYLGY